MSVEENKAFVRRWNEAFNQGKAATMAAMDEIFATDWVGHGFGEADILGIEGFARAKKER